MKLLFLPTEILKIINDNLSLIDKKGLLLVNKNTIFKSIIINEYNSIIKIQLFYKNNLPRLPLVQHYNSTYDSMLSKKLMIRRYIASYPMNYLVRIPENYVYTLSNALNMNSWGINLENNSSLVLEEIGEWITNNLPEDKDCRSRRDIRKFLTHRYVTKSGLRYLGW